MVLLIGGERREAKATNQTRHPPLRTRRALSLCGFLAVVGCGGDDADPVDPGPSRGDPHDLLWVTIDGLRSDLGQMDGAVRSEMVTRWQRNSVVWSRTIAPSPEPAASLASAFTGMPPWEHGLRTEWLCALPDSATTLAERLRETGFECRAILSRQLLGAASGLTQGFEHVDGPQLDPLPWRLVGDGAEVVDLRRGVDESLAAAQGDLQAAWSNDRSDFRWLQLELDAARSPGLSAEERRDQYQRAAVELLEKVLVWAATWVEPREGASATVVVSGTCGRVLGEDGEYDTRRSIAPPALETVVWIRGSALTPTVESRPRSLRDLHDSLWSRVTKESTSPTRNPIEFEAVLGALEDGGPILCGQGEAESRQWFDGRWYGGASHRSRIDAPPSHAWQQPGALYLRPGVAAPALDGRTALLATPIEVPVSTTTDADVEEILAWDGLVRGEPVPDRWSLEQLGDLAALHPRAAELWLVATIAVCLEEGRSLESELTSHAERIRLLAERLPGSAITQMLVSFRPLSPTSGSEERLRAAGLAFALAPWSLTATRCLADALQRQGQVLVSQGVLQRYLEEAPLSQAAREEFERRWLGE